MSVSDTNYSAYIIHLRSYLSHQISLDRGRGLEEWRGKFQWAREAWLIEFCRQLLSFIKAQPLDELEQSVVHYHEGLLESQLANWPEAIATFERSLSIKKKSNDYHGEVAVLLSLATALRHDEMRFKEAFDLYQSALVLTTQQDDRQAQAYTLNSIGNAYVESAELEKAYDAFTWALEIARGIEDLSLAGKVLHNLGSVVWERGRLDEARKFLSESQAICQQLKDPHGLMETINSLALIDEAEGQLERAEQMFREVLEYFIVRGDKYRQAQVMVNLGNVLWRSGQMTDAHYFYTSGLELAQEINDANLEGRLLSSLGSVYVKQGLFEEAGEVYQSALARKKAGGDVRSLKHTYLELGASYHQQRQLELAEWAYQQALKQAQQQKDLRTQTATMRNLAAVAVGQSDVDKAIRWITEAMPIAGEAKFEEISADLHRMLGDVEMLKPQCDHLNMFVHYYEAVEHARNFSEVELREVLTHISDVLLAIAEDGHSLLANNFCEEFVDKWREFHNYDNDEVVPFFQRLSKELHPGASQDTALA